VDLTDRIAAVRGRVTAAAQRAGRDPASVRVIGAVKSVAPAIIEAAVAAGLTDLGENFVQEATAHRAALNEAARAADWHLIGHLQTNKAGVASDLFATIHSVDSLRLAQQLSRRSTRNLRVLVEVNVAGEASKSGVSPAETGSLVAAMADLEHIEPVGLMTIAPAVRDPEDVRAVFRELRELAASNGLSELSMGMTDDFEVAIAEGATMVRIGRAIFGERAR